MKDLGNEKIAKYITWLLFIYFCFEVVTQTLAILFVNMVYQEGWMKDAASLVIAFIGLIGGILLIKRKDSSNVYIIVYFVCSLVLLGNSYISEYKKMIGACMADGVIENCQHEINMAYLYGFAFLILFASLASAVWFIRKKSKSNEERS